MELNDSKLFEEVIPKSQKNFVVSVQQNGQFGYLANGLEVKLVAEFVR